MPNYDYHCMPCNVDFEEYARFEARDEVKHSCGTLAERKYSVMQRPQVFRAGFFPHLDTKPVYAGSKQQLKDECNKRDKFMPYAWD